MANRSMEVKILFQEHDPIGKLMDLINAGHVIGGIGLNQTIDGRAKIAKELRAAQVAAGGVPQLDAPKKPKVRLDGPAVRLEILNMLAEHGPLSVKGVADKMGREYSAVSYHMMNMMKVTGEVTRRPDMTFILTASGKKKIKAKDKPATKVKGFGKKPRKGSTDRKPSISGEAGAAIRENILKALQNGPATLPKLSTDLGHETGVISWQTVKLRRSGFIRTGESGWEITADGENELIKVSSHLSQNAAE